MDKSIIEINQLSFNYNKSCKVLDNISMNVPQGSIYGFIGANGAGKTTTMRLITGLIPDRNSKIKLLGKKIKDNIPDIFNNVGTLIETPAIYDHMSGYKNLRYVATLKRVSNSKIHEILRVVDLQDAKDKKAGQYSLGMKQRLAIGMALIGDPELLILDEPVNGLDPYGIIDIRNLLLDLNQNHGKTIFISSHLLDEVEKICTDIGIISKGKICFEGKIEDLRKLVNKGSEVVIKLDNSKEWFTDNIKFLENAEIKEDSLVFNINGDNEMSDILQTLISTGAIIKEVITNNNLENNFLELITNN